MCWLWLGLEILNFVGKCPRVVPGSPSKMFLPNCLYVHFDLLEYLNPSSLDFCVVGLGLTLQECWAI